MGTFSNFEHARITAEKQYSFGQSPFEETWQWLQIPISLFAKQETIVVHETKSLKSPISSKMDFALAQSPRNLLKRKEKKSQNNVILAQLTVVDNWGLIEYRIDNNWKLDDWNDKTEN